MISIKIIFFSILHIACVVIYSLNAKLSNKKSEKILWTIGALCWGVNIIWDIVKIYLMING